MMATAMFAGVPFRINPTAVSGGFRVKSKTTHTIGGKVVQIYGTTWDNLVVEGSFGKGGATEQDKFLARMTTLFDDQVDGADPVRFVWPGRNWDLHVFLVSYSSKEGQNAIVRDSTIVAPTWVLNLYVVEDNGGLSTGAKSTFLEHLSIGLGWKQTEYNGPLADVTGLFNPATTAPSAPSAQSGGGGGGKKVAK